ncbi:hypothetical protein GIB67_024612 [Kingdonia uniflora]|uniref:Uncharacterized protein n=1 Tax=Kingdonia uniflora TaxID=39325 RepID=A0A7J7LNZ1_9MAGN|nr:hypothetical protein GIB67_024612 [Kingdonia uniflora]
MTTSTTMATTALQTRKNCVTPILNPVINFIVEELFDFSNDDGVIGDETFGESNESSPTATTVIGSCNSSNFNADTA